MYGKSELLRKLIIPVTGPGDSPLRALQGGRLRGQRDLYDPRPRRRASPFSLLWVCFRGADGFGRAGILLGASGLAQFFGRAVRAKHRPAVRGGVSPHDGGTKEADPRDGDVVEEARSLGPVVRSTSRRDLGKQGRGATPVTAVMTRDLHSARPAVSGGQAHKLIINVTVKSPKSPAAAHRYVGTKRGRPQRVQPPQLSFVNAGGNPRHERGLSRSGPAHV